MSVDSSGSTGWVSVASPTPSPSQSVVKVQSMPSAVPLLSRSRAEPSASSVSLTPSLSSSMSTRSQRKSPSKSFAGKSDASNGSVADAQLEVSSASV